MVRPAATSGQEAAAVDTLCDLVVSSRASTIAVVGLAKNVGKTTALNAILSHCTGPLGLTSLGLDGEATDHLTGLAKPRISPPEGTLVATTTGSLQRSAYALRSQEQLPFRTPLGPVVVGVASGLGCVEVSGPTTLAELAATVTRLRERGARLILVDGAINRLGSASPSVSDGVVVATGAMVGDGLDETVETTAATLDLLSIREVPREERDALARFTNGETRLTALDTAGRILPLAADTTVISEAPLARTVARLAPATLVVGGALTANFLDDLVRLLPPRAQLRLVVRDATAVIAPPRTVTQCLRRGIALEAVTGLRVLAVTTNPCRLSQAYPADILFTAVVKAIGDRFPVFDVVGGLASLPSRRPAMLAGSP